MNSLISTKLDSTYWAISEQLTHNIHILPNMIMVCDKKDFAKNVRCPASMEFLLNNHIITNLDEIAYEFNEYFVNIGKSLSDQIQSVTTSEDYMLEHNKPDTMFNFVSVNEVYIDNVINTLKNTLSYGYDNISNKHIK